MALLAERRSDPRYPFSCEMSVRHVSLHGSKKSREDSFPGELQDVSSGGCCLLTDRRVGVSDLIRCDIHFFDLPIRIPILCRVRWIQKTADEKRYLAGAQFLI